MALTAAKKHTFKPKGFLPWLVGASTKIYQGAMVILSSGYAVKGADTASARFAGIAQSEKDNSSGSAGDLTVVTDTTSIFEAKATDAAQATWLGQKVYVKDDEEVALAAGVSNNVLAGICVEVISATKVRVWPVIDS